jgi:hypothetical protein
MAVTVTALRDNGTLSNDSLHRITGKTLGRSLFLLWLYHTWALIVSQIPCLFAAHLSAAVSYISLFPFYDDGLYNVPVLCT